MTTRLSDDLLERIRGGGPQTGRAFTVESPIDGSTVTHVADCDKAEACQAADQAAVAFDSWKQTTSYERAALLRRWSSLIIEHEAHLARLVTWEMGKPITEATAEARYAASFVEWFAEEAKRVYGETVPSQFPGKRIIVLRQPAGIVYGITPWNFPLAMVTRKVAPALAAGCTFVLKPAEQSPLSALYLATLWREAGGPSGTFQVLPALDPGPVSEVLLDDARVRILTFTGSTSVGIQLYQRCAKTVKRLGLELGGHAPFLIFPDANLDAAVREVVTCKFRNGGQTCVCANRIYVHEKIADDFAWRLSRAVASLRVGNPFEVDTQIGPLVNEEGLAKVHEHITDAVEKGARVLTGGKRIKELYFAPTVLTEVSAGMRVLEEETFGPVAPVLTFRDDSQAVRLANDTPYGLAAYLWTRDMGRGYQVAEALEYGIVGINDGVPATAQAPFGGLKNSGIGREGGHWGIEEFLDLKCVSLSLA